ncbi:hypothetical protein ACQCU3_03660 [Bacillus altitudinis]|uniref:hypothetical protein n=2 Tax=Bacillus TaxID=1386 RepID=UPI0011E94A15|nr:hypothetical protein [Bacillus altitudinis]TYS30595.1 hypothetical protein FZC69_01680 [Bacillus altitudinis]
MNSELWELVKENIAVIAAGLTFITAVLSAVIAFVSNIRHKDLDRFYKNAEENLYNLIEPMYFKMEKIEKINDERHKMEAIRNYFKTYNPEKINISKLGNRQLINKFLDSYTAFHQYLTKIDDDSLRKLFNKIRSFGYSLEKEYWKLFETIYKDHNWFKKTVGMNYIFRLFLRISVFIESTFYAVTWMLFVLFWMIFIYAYGPGSPAIVDDADEILKDVISIFILSLITLYMTMAINLMVTNDAKQKKTFSDYATAGLTYLWKKGSLKRRERKKEKATHKEERERADSIEESD